MVLLISFLAISYTRLVAVEKKKKNGTAGLKYHNVQVYSRMFVCKWDIVFAYNIQLLLILDVYSIYKILCSGVQQQNNSYFCSILEDYSRNAICVKCQLAL